MRVQQPREDRLRAGRQIRRHRAQAPALPVFDCPIVRQQQLERLSFDQQDPLTGSQPTVRVLLREVTAFRLRFYADGRWQETWDRPQRLPQGLEITLTLANSGEITRLFLLTPGGGQ